jgi:hypothetical protein
MSCCSPAGIYNITARQGATFSRVITWTDSAKTPYSIGGWVGRMHVRETVDAANTILVLTTANDRISLGSTANTAGQITLSVDASTMSNVAAGQYVYDLELENPDTDEVWAIIEGNFVVKAEVTR